MKMLLSGKSKDMTQFFSDKLRVVSFISIILVMYIHSMDSEGVYQGASVSVIVRNCISGVLGPCAVPMFFAISGYLFFFSLRNGISDVFLKIKKRVNTLLIPFVIAAILYPLQPILKAVILNITPDKDYIQLIKDLPVIETLKCMFYDSGTNHPWAYHLWFLRDLIIIVIASPLLFYLRRWTGYLSVIVIVALYAFFPDLSFLYGMIWFVAGSLFLDSIREMPLLKVIAMFSVFLALAICRFTFDIEPRYYRIIEIAFGITSLWCMYDYVVNPNFRLKDSKVLNFVCQFTFFLYLFHVPTLHAIYKGLLGVFGKNEFGYTLTYLLSPVVFIPLGLLAGFILKKYTPIIYKIIVGNR